nr:hypothetical protein [Kocuria atrinae]
MPARPNIVVTSHPETVASDQENVWTAASYAEAWTWPNPCSPSRTAIFGRSAGLESGPTPSPTRRCR